MVNAAAIAVPIVVVAVLAVIAFVWWYRRKRDKDIVDAVKDEQRARFGALSLSQLHDEYVQARKTGTIHPELRSLVDKYVSESTKSAYENALGKRDDFLSVRESVLDRADSPGKTIFDQTSCVGQLCRIKQAERKIDVGFRKMEANNSSEMDVSDFDELSDPPSVKVDWSSLSGTKPSDKRFPHLLFSHSVLENIPEESARGSV